MKTMAVIGISSFGHYMCRYLSEQGVQVLAVDNRESRVDPVKDIVQKAVICDASRRQTLEELELHLLDGVIVSLGEHIDTSVLVTLYLKQLGVKQIIAKAGSSEHQQILEHVGATRVVFPERDMAHTVAQQLGSRNLLQYVQLDSEYSVIELPPPTPWIGRTLAELSVRRNWAVQILLIHNSKGSGSTVSPDGEYIFDPRDQMVVIGKGPALDRLKAAR